MPADTFAWADGAAFAREWERDLVKRAELAGASKEDASAAYEAFHARSAAASRGKAEFAGSELPWRLRWSVGCPDRRKA